jgi:hypothetical protein
MGERGVVYRILMGNLGDSVHLGDTCIDGIIIKWWNFWNFIEVLWTGSICLRIGVVCRQL